MANYAALIAPLNISGSRLSTGAANASGKVWAFQPGTSTTVNVYSDAAATAIVTQPITLTEGGLLNRTDLPGGLFATQPIRLYIEDVSGNAVSDAVYIPATAGNVGVSNAGFTDSTLDAVLTDALTSFGGQDWKYLESSGATERTIKAKFSEIWISVKDFGAVGDGVAIDTTAIQNAINRVKALGGGVVYIPPGTYVIDQALALTTGLGVRIVGAGTSSTLSLTNATANMFTFNATQDCSVENLDIDHTSTSTGAGISLTTSFNFLVSGVFVSGDYAYGVDHSAATTSLIRSSDIRGSTRCVRYNTTGATGPTAIIDSFLINVTGTAIEINGAQGRYGFARNSFAATTGVLINAAYTGTTGITIVGCTDLGTCTTPISIGTAGDPNLRQWGNGVDGSTTNVASGGTFTPNRAAGPQQRCRVTSVGANITVAAPTPPPLATMFDVHLELMFFNDGGADTTGWTVNAAYHLSAAPSVTLGQITSYRLKWDPSAGVWREISRAVTT